MSIPQPFDAAAWNASLQDARILGSAYIVHPFFGIDFGRELRGPGHGLIDFPRIFGSTRKVEEYIVERDDAGSPPRAPADALDTARVGFEYLAGVRF